MFTKQMVLMTLHNCKLVAGDIKEETGELPVQFQISNPDTSAEAMITVDHDLRIVYLVFKGSKEFKDWVFDSRFHKETIDYSPVAGGPVRVHSGFNNAEYSIHYEVLAKTHSLLIENPMYTLMIGGHSLGKSMAELFAYRLFQYDALRTAPRTMVYICSFGGAHTGNAAFGYELSNMVHQNIAFYNEKDIVPKLLEGKFNYYRSGTPYKLEDIKGCEGSPANIVAAMVNHDIVRDYELPIKNLNCDLNASIFSAIPEK